VKKYRLIIMSVALLGGLLVSASPKAAFADDSYAYNNWAGYASPQEWFVYPNGTGNPNHMNSFSCLWAQQSDNVLYSTNGLYRLLMQTDGNVVEADAVSNSLLWDTAAHGGKAGLPAANYRLCIQNDGNLVEAAPPYGISNVIWQSATGGHSCGCALTLQNDANLVDGDGSTALWFDGANTAPDAPYFTVYGQWNVPQNTSSTEIGDWVGIVGRQVTFPGNASIIQAGTETTSGVSRFWIEDYPQGIQLESLPVSPGDFVAVQVQNDLNGWVGFELYDFTKGEYTPLTDQNVPYRASVSPVAIHEDMGSSTTMPNFTSVPFQQCEYEETSTNQPWYSMTSTAHGGSATNFSTVQPIPNGTTKATAGSIDGSGDFTVSFVHN
jgi:hypothetical protein